nr:immunoglobulin light chain junction region [Macaca mulatta]
DYYCAIWSINTWVF